MSGITTKQALQLIKLAVHARHAEHELGWHEALLHVEWYEEGDRRAFVRLVGRRRKSAEVAAKRLTSYIQTIVQE